MNTIKTGRFLNWNWNAPSHWWGIPLIYRHFSFCGFSPHEGFWWNNREDNASMYILASVNDMKILLCRFHSSHITHKCIVNWNNVVDVLWKHNITVIMPGDKHQPSTPAVSPVQQICLEDDMGNENHLLPDSINSVRGLEVAGLDTLLIPLKYLKNIHCTSRWEMPNFLPFPDVPVQMFSEESFKGKKVICLWKRRSCLPLLTRSRKKLALANHST